MAKEEDKNKLKEQKAKIKALELQMKTNFKEGHFDALKETATKLKALDPENHLSAKLLEKVENIQKKAKVAEYEAMLKKLTKEGDFEKVQALAKELKEFDPKAKAADKFAKKADKMLAKAKGKEAKKEEKPAVKAEAKPEAKKEAKRDEKKEKKPGFFAKLFKKKDEGKKPENVFAKAMGPAPAPKAPAAKPAAPAVKAAPAPTPLKPLAPKAPVAPVPKAAPAAPTVKAPEVKPLEKKPVASVPQPKLAPMVPKVPASPKTPAKPGEAKGNLFTKMFKKDEKVETQKSIIDTIVAKTDKKDEEKKKKAVKAKPVMAKKPKKHDATGLLNFSRVFMNFTAIFIVFSAAFLYVEFLDEENTMLSLVGVEENTGSRLKKAADENLEYTKQESVLNANIERFKSGYEDPALLAVNQIIDDRINWPDIFSKINEVTNSVYELNDFFKYIEYNNYSFDAKNKTIRVSGALSDPLGRNLTKLVELEEAFKFYPADKNNPEDQTKPYFTGFREFTSFSKTLDQQSGRYNSNFQLSFALNE